MSRRVFWATALVAALTLSAVLAAPSSRPERLHVAIGPAPARPFVPPTTTEPPVTTTTLAPEPPPIDTSNRSVARTETNGAAPQWPASLEPCGGDLPPCWVKQRESGGSYTARNNESAGAACGAWQIIGSTWAGYGGYPDACSAPPAVQDAKARELWANGAGCAHWSAC